METTRTDEAERVEARAAGIALQPLIEDHALIGDMHTAALVTKAGTIDWLCLPAFDGDACFASLLGTEENGFWRISPTDQVREVRRRYRPDTLILETDFVTDSGTVRLTDFMVPEQQTRQLVRTVQALEGTVRMRAEFKPRFAFGRARPLVTEHGEYLRAMAGGDSLYLRGGPRSEGARVVDEFVVAPKSRISWVMSWGASFEEPPFGVNAARAERDTERFWQRWASKIVAPKRYRDVVVRSLITLKACTYQPTGGIVAAPTTSLPETLGGVRNWDYRFTWLRDSALAIRALMNAGLSEEAENFRDWATRAVAGDAEQIQIMYGLRGERRLTESELPWFEGYSGAKPVRVGNGAYDQFQLDVFGEVAMLLSFAQHKFGKLGPVGARMLVRTAEFVAENWKKPDRGIWEMRGPERSFTASKVSAWAAIDSAVRAIDSGAIEYDAANLRAVRQEIFDEVCEKGFNKEKNCFTQYYGGTDLDGSLLGIPLLGFLPATDPRVVGTVAAIERELLEGGLVLRFRPVGAVDGLSGDESPFLACSFWLADTYHLMGRHEDARALFERLIGLANDVGLIAEEYDPHARRQIGNFPQAFTHFALVNCAYLLEGMDPEFGEVPMLH